MSFPSLVASLKNLREKEETGGAMTSAHVGGAAGAPEKQLLDLVSLGSGAAIPEGRSHAGFKNSEEMDMICTAGDAENIVPNGTKNRKPIPRWS